MWTYVNIVEYMRNCKWLWTEIAWPCAREEKGEEERKKKKGRRKRREKGNLPITLPVDGIRTLGALLDLDLWNRLCHGLIRCEHSSYKSILWGVMAELSPGDGRLDLAFAFPTHNFFHIWVEDDSSTSTGAGLLRTVIAIWEANWKKFEIKTSTLKWMLIKTISLYSYIRANEALARISS